MSILNLFFRNVCGQQCWSPDLIWGTHETNECLVQTPETHRKREKLAGDAPVHVWLEVTGFVCNWGWRGGVMPVLVFVDMLCVCVKTYVCMNMFLFYMNTFWAPHLEMNPEHFTVATLALLSASEQTHYLCVCVCVCVHVCVWVYVLELNIVIIFNNVLKRADVHSLLLPLCWIINTSLDRIIWTVSDHRLNGSDRHERGAAQKIQKVMTHSQCVTAVIKETWKTPYCSWVGWGWVGYLKNKNYTSGWSRADQKLLALSLLASSCL